MNSAGSKQLTFTCVAMGYGKGAAMRQLFALFGHAIELVTKFGNFLIAVAAIVGYAILILHYVAR